jgi:hypothetical protein
MRKSSWHDDVQAGAIEKISQVFPVFRRAVGGSEQHYIGELRAFPVITDKGRWMTVVAFRETFGILQPE